MSLSAALEEAQSRQMDLVEIAPEAKPPVVKIIDYKKFRYLEEKKEKEARKKTKQTELKEVRFTPFIGQHDLETGLDKVKRFLSEGHLVKISIVFKGRQMAHQEFGPKLLGKILDYFNGQVQTERPARMEGRRFVTTIRAQKGTKTNGQTENEKSSI